MDKTVVKALRLIEALSNSAEPRGISELARDLALTKSNVHRLLETLLGLGYVNRGENGTYMLSLQIWRLGLQVMSRIDVKEASLPYLEELTRSTGETARLTVFVNDQGVCIQQVQSSNPVGVITQVGGTLLSYCSATGKALLAYQSDEVIERIASRLENFTSHTLSTRSRLDEELEQIRRTGFAINRGEWRENVRGVGAPVWNGDGNVVAAIGVSGPGSRLPIKTLKQLGSVVRNAGMRLSRELGYVVNNER
jgi:IclR family transcriptional regulator, KDG regulon repressor